MKSNTKTKTITNQWVLRHKETGRIFPKFTYKSREAARKAAKGRRFGGMYTPTKTVKEPNRITKVAMQQTQRYGHNTPSAIKSNMYKQNVNTTPKLKKQTSIGRPLHKAGYFA